MANDCLFCKIAAGQLPAHKIYEDDQFLAFLDIRPLNPGNSLVIPKLHHRWVNDVPNFGAYWEVARKIAQTTLPLVGADYVSYLTLGMEVPHAHIRVIPRFFTDAHTQGIDTRRVTKTSPEALAKLALIIFQSLHHDS